MLWFSADPALQLSYFELSAKKGLGTLHTMFWKENSLYLKTPLPLVVNAILASSARASKKVLRDEFVKESPIMKLDCQNEYKICSRKKEAQ
jgi:hypothetical protein